MHYKRLKYNYIYRLNQLLIVPALRRGFDFHTLCLKEIFKKVFGIISEELF